MMTRLARKARTLWRYLWPTPEDRRYLDEIAASGLFDRAFYVAGNPGLNPVFRIWPERHYVQLGEAHGCCPTPEFSPRAYVFHNPELAAEPFPFLHYIRHGGGQMHERPAPAVPEMPKVADGDRWRQADVAVALHLYYLDLWPEFHAALRDQQFDMDLLVTLTDQPGADDLRGTILRDHPTARVWILPNHGRDIWPFAWLVGQDLLQGYRAVAKLHSKRSPHLKNGDIWRHGLVQAVLGDPKTTRQRLHRFLDDPRAGLWVAGDNILQGDKWWSINRPRAETLAARVPVDLDAPLCFPAGSMYWIKSDGVAALAALSLTAHDFDPEEALVDGTTAHAVERLIGPMVQTAGRQIVSEGDLDRRRG